MLFLKSNLSRILLWPFKLNMLLRSKSNDWENFLRSRLSVSKKSGKCSRFGKTMPIDVTFPSNATVIRIVRPCVVTLKTKKVPQWRHKNEGWAEEEWERKPLKKRWIIPRPRFYDVTCLFFEGFSSSSIWNVISK